MSMYIRLSSGFWTCIKTARLRVRIGDDAFWVPPRLWSYAAENQPDGNFGKYTDAEIAMLLGCDKHAQHIKQDLIDTGFLDPDGRIHAWAEHNGYHAAFAERARLAANTRWDREKERKGKRQEKKRDKQCLTHACSMFDAFWAAYPSGPRKVNRAGCLRNWKSNKLDAHADAIMAGLSAWKTSDQWQKDRGQYVPMASTWLNQRRWEGDLPQPKPKPYEPNI